MKGKPTCIHCRSVIWETLKEYDDEDLVEFHNRYVYTTTQEHKNPITHYGSRKKPTLKEPDFDLYKRGDDDV